MRSHRDPEPSARRHLRRSPAAVAAVVLLLGAACGDDGGEAASDTSGADDVAQALGPEDPASGDPVRLGLVSDGQSQAFDARTEIYAAQATVDYWNAHRGGVGGRPIELVTCETGADPGVATDCANRMVEDGVVAVAVGQSTVPDAIWEPLHQAGVPTMFFQTNGERILADAETSFVISNPLTTAFGLPISVAQDVGTDRVAFVVIDVPVAVSLFETLGPPIMENAGLDYDLVKVPLGTPDLTSQMRDLADGGAGVVHVVGNDALCIAAMQGLAAVAYDGDVTAVSQCITDATREALQVDELEGIYVTSGVAVGATEDSTYRRYEAVMGAYSHDVDVENNVSMVGYTVVAGLATSLDGIAGDITAATATETIRSMPEAELPGGGGVMFRCGGSAMAANPALCSNQWLRARLDGEGQPSSYDTVDSTAILEGL
jgi:branched-chain amino acid transport system substrate-binding protein